MYYTSEVLRIENPWVGLPMREPFVLAGDEQIIRGHNGTLNEEDDSFVHLEMHPEAYVGNPHAKVILLNLNPGYYPKRSKPFEREDPEYQERCRANLAHANLDFPFIHLDPELSGTSGDVYYRPRLRSLTEIFGVARVAREILVVEYFPYFTRREIGDIRLLPSQQYTFHLVREAMRRNAIIKLRTRRQWLEAIPELTSYPSYYELNSPQNTCITQRNCPKGFPEILKAFSW